MAKRDAINQRKSVYQIWKIKWKIYILNPVKSVRNKGKILNKYVCGKGGAEV